MTRIGFGGVLLLFAVALANITLATNDMSDYFPLRLGALAIALVSAVLFAVEIMRGTLWTRLCAIGMLLVCALIFISTFLATFGEVL